VVALWPCEFLDRLADLIPQPRNHRHRYRRHATRRSKNVAEVSLAGLSVAGAFGLMAQVPVGNPKCNDRYSGPSFGEA
jgi:hypothetical protein